MPIQVGAGGIGAVRLGSTVIESAYMGASQVFSSVWTPAALFASGEQGAWYDPSDMSTLFQDDAGATPVTAADQTVGRMSDKSGNGNHATQADVAKRPALRTGAGLWWLEFDTVDDVLLLPNLGQFRNKNYGHIFAGIQNSTWAPVDVVLAYSIGTAAGSGRVGLYANVTTNHSALVRRADGDASRQSTVSRNTSAKILETVADFGAANAVTLFVDGVARPSTTLIGSGATSDTDSAYAAIGSQSVFFSRHRGYGYLVTDTLVSAENTTQMREYLAAKTGVTLP